MQALLALDIGVALATIARYASAGLKRTDAALVAVIALGVRLAAAAVVFQLGRANFPEGIWLNDEASFWRATEALLSDPWTSAVPRGLEHLSGNAYLGVTTAIALAAGLDPTNFRLANVGLGTIGALLALWVGQRLFGRRAGLLAGVAVAVWPTLVLWSATMLRDTLCGFLVLVVWWCLLHLARQDWLRTTCMITLALLLLFNLRPYLAGSVLLGVAGWFVVPRVQRMRWPLLALCILPVAALALLAVVQQAKRIDEIAHDVLYRQTVTRMETLGRLYRDPPGPDAPEPELPWTPGAAVVLVDPDSPSLLSGLVENAVGPGVVTVAFTDETVRTVRTKQLTLLNNAELTPTQLLTWVPLNLLSLLTGVDQLNDRATPLWVADALAWDLLLLAAACSAYRYRLGWRQTVFPACVVIGTVLALVTIPGAPGNTDRHRTTHTVQLLLVLASGLMASPVRPRDIARAFRQRQSVGAGPPL